MNNKTNDNELVCLQNFIHQLIVDYVDAWWELQGEKGNAWKPYRFGHRKDGLMAEANSLLKAAEARMENEAATEKDLAREAAQLLGDYEQVELGLLRLITWNQKRRELLDRLDLLRELALVLADYDLIAEGHIERETWRQKMALVLARARQHGVKVVPF